ncbi:MAG: uracil-DNA glycosylase [Desulfobacteraceae bacterium]|nr:uracil-DNA glycosylase [Desulfobacteraceae bacterium]
MPDKRSVLRDRVALWLKFLRELGVETLEMTDSVREFLGKDAACVCPGAFKPGPLEDAQGGCRVPALAASVTPVNNDDMPPPKGKSQLADVLVLLGNCKRCDLHKQRTNIVFGEGPDNARLFIVGEAPGREEDIEARPFVGPSGALLAKMLKAINIDRASAYITSVVKCRPPENRTPRPEEIAACLPFLFMQIMAVSPKFILALGQTAAQSLIGDKRAVHGLRGAFHPLCLNKMEASDIKVLVTYHPAYILRHGGDRQKAIKLEAWRDLQMLQKEYEKIV